MKDFLENWFDWKNHENIEIEDISQLWSTERQQILSWLKILSLIDDWWFEYKAVSKKLTSTNEKNINPDDLDKIKEAISYIIDYEKYKKIM